MGLFDNKKIVVKKYANGEVKDISEISDKMFSEKMLGDGFYIVPSENVTKVRSPIKGKITMVFDTKHAIGIKNKEGIECLIHYGLDTVNLKGKGFKINVSVGDKVNFNNVIMEVNNETLKNSGYETSIIAVFTDINGYKLNKSLNDEELIRFTK